MDEPGLTGMVSCTSKTRCARSVASTWIFIVPGYWTFFGTGRLAPTCSTGLSSMVPACATVNGATPSAATSRAEARAVVFIWFSGRSTWRKFTWCKNVVEVMGRILDAHQMRVPRPAVVIDLERAVGVVVFDQQHDRLLAGACRTDRRLDDG